MSSFPPLVDAGCRVLVLGSMPGVASLEAAEYYAHPRNLFWPLVGEVLGFDPRLAYAQRCAALTARGVAVWDVLAECRRPGSLDSAIARNSERANDVPRLLADVPTISLLLLNGRAAAAALARHHPSITTPRVVLPSTSPANAGISQARKRKLWRAALASARIQPTR